MKYYIGIDLGGTNIVAGVCDENHKILAKASTPTKCPRPAQEIIDDMIAMSRQALVESNVSIDDIEWVGVGCPGTVNQDTGIIEYSNNLEFFNVPMVEMIEKELGKKVFIENDANAAAYGEYVAGSAKEAKISVMITLGTGVGGGIVIHDNIFRGFNFAGAELGHIVIEQDGRPCTCGRNGCFEAYASATGLIKTTKEVMQQNKDSVMWEICDGDINKVNGLTSFDAMRKGDKAGQQVVDAYIKSLACGIINVVNIFQPEILCIGGGVSKEGKYLMEPLKEYFDKEVYSRNSAKNTEIVKASLGNDAGLIGAAMLGFSK